MESVPEIGMRIQQRFSKVCMVGCFPPPLHGMAAVNAAVRDQLRSEGADILVIDVAANRLDRGAANRLRRVPKVLGALIRLLATRRRTMGSMYISVSGGLGQVYECLFVLVARFKRLRVVLHHHSFAYLDGRKWLTQRLVRSAGPNAIHVALSPAMAARLKSLYGVSHCISVSNVVFLTCAQHHTIVPLRRLRVLGFISNIEPEKGVFEFLNLLDAAQHAGYRLAGKLAGPFHDRETERMVHARLLAVPTVEYIGPQYGDDKDVFFANIDALIFPTRYVNEAEPLVIVEAMTLGIPVIAYGRGAIPEIIGPDAGKIIAPTKPFVPAALAQIEAWLKHPDTFEAASIAAAQRLSELRTKNWQHWQTLMTEMLGPPERTISHVEKGQRPSPL